MSIPDQNNTARSKTWLPVALIAGVALTAGVLVSSWTNNDNSAVVQGEQVMKKVQAQLTNSTLFPDDFKKVPAFSLLHGSNEPLTEANLQGQWSVLFFGFSNCPDICPNTLNELNGAVSELSESGSVVPQVIFISVDPVRDTVEKMAEYVSYFNKDFIGGSGDLSAITALTTKLGIVASYTANADGSDDYSVDHTASMLVIDPQLRVRAKLNPPHKFESIVADLKTLFTHYN